MIEYLTNGGFARLTTLAEKIRSMAPSGPDPTFVDGAANGSKEPTLTDAAACTFWQ